MQMQSVICARGEVLKNMQQSEKKQAFSGPG
jgi:hypothetical protein